MSAMPDQRMIGSLEHCGGTRCLLLGRSLRRSFRFCDRHSSHSQYVACRHRELEVLIDSPEASVHRLPDVTHGLAPAKVLFDALSDDLAQNVSRMPCRASIDRAS